MSYSADRPQFGAQPPGASSGGASPYGAPPPWNRMGGWEPPPFVSEILAFRPLRVVLIVLAFIWWWPVGLATLLVMMWARRAGCFNYGSQGSERIPGQTRRRSWGGGGWGCGPRASQSSGNHAFDEYRAETLRRLEEEQKDFVGFLDRLRYAKDKAEFDQFLAERRQRAGSPDTTEHPDQPNQG